MRIAVYYDLARGGAAFALERFVRHLRAGHTVDVIAARGAHPVVPDTAFIGPAPRARGLRGPLYYANRLTEPVRLAALERAERRLADRLAGYDRVLVHSCQGRGAPVLVRALGDRTTLYVTEPLRLYREPRPADAAAPVWWHAARAAYLPMAAALNGADRRHGAAAGVLLANSAYTRGRIREVYDRDAATVFPSVDPAFLETDPGSGGGGYVLSPGALLPQKGHGRVIRALGTLPSPPILVVAGYGGRPGYRRRLSRLAERHGVDLRLELDPGRESLMELVRRADAVAIGAVREPFGLVSLEAQALGRPVVVVREGGLPETVTDGATGIVSDPEPGPLGEALARVLAEPDRASALGRAGRDHVSRRFRPAVCGAALESALAALPVEAS